MEHIEHFSALEYFSLLGAMIVLRVWSAIEHRKGHKEVKDISTKINGSLDKLLKEKYDKGFADGRKAKEI